MSACITPLPPAAIRARRRPLAILWVYLAELAWALLVATPVHAWARRAWGAHPDGDAVLWLPGGRELLVWFGQQDAAIGVVSRTAMVLLVAATIAMQVPLGALIASLAFAREGETDAGAAPARSIRSATAVRIGTAAFMPLAGLLVIGSLAAIVVLVVGAVAGGAVDHAFVERVGDAWSFGLRLGTVAVFALVAALIGVVVDLARAAIARDAGIAVAKGTTTPGWTMMLRSVRTALAVARHHLASATMAWAARAALSVGLVAVGAAASQALGGKSGGALLLLWFIHQAIVLGRVAVRASWLARAIGFIAAAQDARRAASTPADATSDAEPTEPLPTPS